MMLREKIEKASGNLGNSFRVEFKGKMFATLRDEHGNIKETREVDI